MFIKLSGNGSAVVKLSQDDMEKYCLSFSTMGLSDDATKKLLEDLFPLLESMGMTVKGAKMTIECARSDDAPVTLVVKTGVKRVFELLSPIAIANALELFLAKLINDGSAQIIHQNDAWKVEISDELSDHDEALLTEFCTPLFVDPLSDLF
ncbi:MAG: hypothetical protein J6L81_11060 [Clostridia bacterium]|nr:hypothetical protein [Clostridia bacterium]